MRRKHRYYQVRHGHSYSKPQFLRFFAVIALYGGFVMPGYWKLAAIAPFLIAVVVTICLFIRNKKRQDTTEIPEDYIDSADEQILPGDYVPKKSIMTDCEKIFFKEIKKIVEPRYIIQPQINLASVIDKIGYVNYRNELFRNIDFGIFDSNYKVLVLIEINDQTHIDVKRKERDKKVKMLCEAANIPLLVLWTKYGANPTYIRSKLAELLELPQENQSVEILQ